MKFRIGILFVSSMFFCHENNAAKPQVPQQSWLEQFLENEDRKIGAKSHHGSAAYKSYQAYLKAASNGDPEVAGKEWQQFQKERYLFKDASTPTLAYAGYGTFAYWLYRRISSPVGKKNWGAGKKAMALTILPVWLLKDAVLSDSEFDKKKEKLNEEQDKQIKALKDQCAVHESAIKAYKAEKEEDDVLYNRAINKCMSMSQDERKAYMTPAEIKVDDEKAKEEIERIKKNERALKLLAESKVGQGRIAVANGATGSINHGGEEQKWYLKLLGWYVIKTWFPKQ